MPISPTGRTEPVSIPFGQEAQIARNVQAVPWGDWAEKAILSTPDLRDNWDGYGGVPPKRELVRDAMQLLFAVRRHVAAGLVIAEPFVSATPDGGVLYAWDLIGGRSLEVELSPRPTGNEWSYSLFDPATRTGSDGVIPDGWEGGELPAVLTDLLVQSE